MTHTQAVSRIPCFTLFFTIMFAGLNQSAWAKDNPLNSEVLTLNEAAQMLRVEPDKVKQLASQKIVPARQIGTEWRFSRSALVHWLNDDEPRVSHAESHSLSQLELSTTRGKGTKHTTSKKPKNLSKNQDQDTIGEKPKQKSADEIFLRDQAVLLKEGQMTLELGLSYAQNDDRQNVVIPIETEQGSMGILPDLEQNTFISNFSVRYGLLDDVQAFVNIPFVHRSQTVSFGSQTLADTSDTEWGDVTAGIRYAALHEGSGYPGVIFSLEGSIPTQDAPFSAGGSIALTKSIDPAVLFANIGYRHHFNNGVDNEQRFRAENQVNARVGIAYALNDTLTLSTSISGVFSEETTIDKDAVLPEQERYSLHFGVTSYLAKGLYIEPSVSFGLNGNSSDVTFGINIPYTFDW